MKILQVVPYFYPAWAYGGPAKLVYDTSKYFASKGHEVTVYTSDCFDDKKRMPESKYIKDIFNLKVFYFKNISNKVAYIFNLYLTPSLIPQSIKEISSVDIIHIHDFYTIQNVWICLLGYLFKKPYILSVHGCLEDKRIIQRGIFKRVFLELFGKRMLKGASAVIATSPNEIKSYQSYGIDKKRIYELGHGIDLNELDTKLSKIDSKKVFNFPQSNLVVTFLGRIHKIKGLDILVDAIDKIQIKNVSFIIAGSDDGYLPTLKEDIKKRKLENKIRLLGTCYGEEKARLYKATDIFVYPSYSEGFSLGILEAAGAGLPLVITTGCHFEEVEREKAGIIVEPKSQVLASAISTLLKNAELRSKMASNAKKLIKERYSMEVIGNKLLEIYFKVPKSQSLFGTLKLNTRKIVGLDPKITTSISCESEYHGAPKAGWTIFPNLSEKSVVYSFGIGEDISFDLSLINRFNCDVWAFDPTPRSLNWLKKQRLPNKMKIYKWGLADFNGKANFQAPENDNFVSYKLSKNSKSSSNSLQVYKLKTIMKRLKHNKIDLLKMDIESAEYSVIDDIIRDKIKIGQILIEFHHRFSGFGKKYTEDSVRKLEKAGYKLFSISEGGNEYSFLKI